MVNRLKEYINYRKLLPSQFADAAGWSRSMLSQFTHGVIKSLNNVTISKIHAVYPDLSISWLLFGEGEMILNVDKQENNQQSELKFIDENAIDESDAGFSTKNEQENEPLFLEDDHTPPPYTTTKDILSYQKDIQHTRLVRRITRIMVFYDDNTYECFNQVNKIDGELK